MWLKNLTTEELAKALKPTFDEFFAKLSPEQKAEVDYDNVVRDAYRLLHGEKVIRDIRPRLKSKAEVSPCCSAVIIVGADAFGMVFQLAGINEEESRAAAMAILAGLDEDTIKLIQSTIDNFDSASSAFDMAQLMYNIIMDIYHSVGISGIMDALEETMAWYDWLLTGITLALQLAAIFASDGISLVIEISLETVYLAQFAEDIVAANGVCS